MLVDMYIYKHILFISLQEGVKLKKGVRHLGFYQNLRWRKRSKQIYFNRHSTCERCKKIVGKNEYAVHHIIELTPDNYKDDNIAYGDDNLLLLCRECHEKEHRTFDPVKIRENRIKKYFK
jgi:hypothetical protein